MIDLLSDPVVFPFLAGLLGLLVGSFLNVAIYRLPIMMEREWQSQFAELKGETTPARPVFNLVVPRSACTHCGHAIPWYENIPVLSYFILGGKCSACGTPISFRYPVVEAFSALLTAGAAWRFGFDWHAAAAFVLIWSLIVLTVIDLDTLFLPDGITLPLVWLGLLINLDQGFATLSSAVLGAVTGYLSLWLVYHLFRLLTGKEGMGFGDFKLLAALGAWFGWTMLPLIILLSSLIGALVGVAMVLLAGHDRQKPIPFGPYLALAGLVTLFFGDAIMTAYLG